MVIWPFWPHIYSLLLLVQPLARMGATVTRFDAVEKIIKIACIHAVWSFSDVKCDILDWNWI